MRETVLDPIYVTLLTKWLIPRTWNELSVYCNE